MEDDCKDLICDNVCCINQSQDICMLHYNPKLIRMCIARLRYEKIEKAFKDVGIKFSFK